VFNEMDPRKYANDHLFIIEIWITSINK